MKLFVRNCFFRLFLFGALLSLPGSSHAQSNAALRGRISDPSGAAIVGAAIEIQPVNNTGQPIRAATSNDGGFSIDLPAGRYRITVQTSDFAPATQDVSLACGAGETLDFHLHLAPMSSNVIVSAEALPVPAAAAVVPTSVITRADIDQQDQPWLTPLLATVPGIAFSRLGPEGGVTSIFLDGGNANYAKIFVDGVPEDVSLPGISIDLSNATTDDIDKIEIVHGAASALYGSDAMTGVLDVFSHRGTTHTPLLDLRGEGGTFDTGLGSGQLSGLLGRFDYSATAAYFSTRGESPGVYVLQNFGPNAYPYFRDTTLSGNFGWKFSDADSLRLTLRNQASDAGQPGQTLLPTALFAVSPGEDSVLHDFGSGLSWDFSVGSRWQNHVEAYDSRMQDAIPLFELVDKFNRAGLDARSTYLFGDGGVTVGYAFENETGGALGRHDQAGYLEIRYPFGPRLTTVVGGRVEANDSFGTRFVPRVGASYALRDGSGFLGATRLRASYGQGIKEPPLFPSDCTPVLKPEQSATFDAGIDQDFASSRIRISAAFFHNDFRDIVSFESSGAPSSWNCPAFAGSYFNTDKARAYGADASFQIKAARWLSVAGTYSYDDSRVLASPDATDPALIPGNRLLKRPLNSANLLVNAHVRRLNWNLVGYYVGPRTDSDFLGLGRTRNPGYVRWDTSASLALRYGVTFTAHIENLFDKHYQDAVGYPALGYNYRLGIRYVWGGKG